MNSFLSQATAEGSSLTRSFWYGRFLQALPSGSLGACQQELQSGGVMEGDARTTDVITDGVPACKNLHSQAMYGETRLQHVRDAMECLSTHETSLSPGVFSLITTSVPRTPAADDGAPSISDILTQDYCLNWPILSEYFKGTVICFSMMIDLHTNIETCIQFQSPTCIRMQSYTYTNFARAAGTV